MPAAGIIIREPVEALAVEVAIKAPAAGVEQPSKEVNEEPA